MDQTSQNVEIVVNHPAFLALVPAILVALGFSFSSPRGGVAGEPPVRLLPADHRSFFESRLPVAKRQGAAAAEAWLKRHGEATLSFDEDDIRRIVGVQLSSHLASDAGLARLRALDSLRTISLWATSPRQLTDRGLRYLAELPELEFIHAAPNHFTDQGLKYLKSSKSLRGLVLEPARVSNEGLAALSDLCCLQSLSLNGARIDDAGLRSLDKLEHLQFLSLRRTQVTEQGLTQLRGRVSEDLMTISGPRRLRTLLLPYETQLSSEGVVELVKTWGMTRLETVDPIYPPAPEVREALEEYRDLVTYWRDERGAYVEFAEGAEGLEIVGLYFEPSDREQPLSLFGLPKSLKRLSLRDTNVDDEELLAELGELEQLETLNLFNTGLPPVAGVPAKPGKPAQPALPGTPTRPGRPYMPPTPESGGAPPAAWQPGITDRGLDGLAQLGLPNLRTVVLDDDEERISAAAVQRFEQMTGARVIRRALADQPPACCPRLDEEPSDEAPARDDSPRLIARLR